MEKPRNGKRTQEMEFSRNRESSMGETLHTMAVEIPLLRAHKP
jgi:hypothetical protein